ncbi:fec operon regulator FecR [compost metagenome]
MAPTTNRLQELFNLYTTKTASPDEIQELWDYINDPLFSEAVDELINKDYSRNHQDEGFNENQQSLLLKNILNAGQQPKQIRLWPRIVAVACMIIVMFSISYYVFQPAKLKQNELDNVSVQNDIAPGKNTATLTLANGEIVALSEQHDGVIIDGNKVSYTNGALAQNLRSAGMLLAQTPRGGTYIVTLSDGTKVWLNNESKLYFPSAFEGKERTVKLEGEAYFEVATDYTNGKSGSKKPFFVETKYQTVKVLGTHFNISAYNNENSSSTTLLEGKVEVKGAILVPGQQAIVDSEGKLQIREVSVEEIVAWKNGDFLFNEEKLSSLIKKIARWYDVDINIEQVDGDKLFTGQISRSRRLKSVLELLSLSSNISFNIKERRVLAIEK